MAQAAHAQTEVDPVCGMAVDSTSAAATVIHEGKTYHFCSTLCASSFRADPVKFLSGGATGMPAATKAAGHYTPLLVVIGVILAAVALAARDWQGGTFSVAATLGHFMVGFFLTFASFKLMDLRGFADGYATYDLLARRVPGYGYVCSA